LPREQLVGEWRELSLIASNILKKGSPNHILCNFIMDYDFDHFISYAYYIREEMTRRGYRTMESVWEKIIALKPNYIILPLEKVFFNKMNDIYLNICYYNLYEKYLCGGIDYEDWREIDELAKSARN